MRGHCLGLAAGMFSPVNGTAANRRALGEKVVWQMLKQYAAEIGVPESHPMTFAVLARIVSRGRRRVGANQMRSSRFGPDDERYLGRTGSAQHQ